MMFIPLLTLVAMSGQPVPQWAPDTPIVQVGVYAYQADGTISARAYGTPPLDSVVWTSESLCQTGAGRLLTGTPPAHAWKFSGSIISQTADEAVIQLEWQRTHDHGQSVSGRGGSVQLTLRRGEPAPLDFASPTASACGVASVAFEARYEPRFRLPGVGSGSGGGVGAGSRGGIGSGGGGVAVSGSASSSTSRTVDGSSRSARVGGGRRAEMFDVNLWLVHTAPGREEEVRHQAVRSTPEGARFAFAPLTIDVAGGQVSVQVNGSYSITENGRQLAFTTNRVVAFRPTAESTNGTTVASSKGEGKTVIDMPGPDDVVVRTPLLRCRAWSSGQVRGSFSDPGGAIDPFRTRRQSRSRISNGGTELPEETDPLSGRLSNSTRARVARGPAPAGRYRPAPRRIR